MLCTSRDFPGAVCVTRGCYKQDLIFEETMTINVDYLSAAEVLCKVPKDHTRGFKLRYGSVDVKKRNKDLYLDLMEMNLFLFLDLNFI